MKRQHTTLHDENRTCAMTWPVPGRKPVLTLTMRLLWAALLMAPAFRALAGVELTTLHSFNLLPNGGDPEAALVQGNDGYFYGTTRTGGTNGGGGTVFRISTNGVLTTLYAFTGRSDGGAPQGLLMGRDGNLYGTTYAGGTNAYGYGTVFRISPNGALTTLYSFTGSSDAPFDSAGLVQGKDGYFYGTAGEGGTNGLGSVFRISTNGALTTLYSFTGPSDGAFPMTGLVQGNDGYFYGTTSEFGPSGRGTVFRISPSGALTTLYSFTNYAAPSALVQGSDGNFYGTTDYGGTNGDYGTVFRISTNGVLTTLYSFTSDRAYRKARLVQGNDGYFYGTTSLGGTSFAGTVFRISPNGALTTLYSFPGSNDGIGPAGGLVQGSDGSFYGTTESGGTNSMAQYSSSGTVYKISTNGALTTLHTFGGSDGANPVAALVQGSDGYFYGTTEYGGTNGTIGTVFRINANGVLTTLHFFTGGNDGASPNAALVQGSDGYFYGMTSGDDLGIGADNPGTVFRISTNGALTTLYSIGVFGHSLPDGLAQGGDGSLYATTFVGGTNRTGAVFKITTNGLVTTLYSFAGSDGSNPAGSLVQGSDGYFYGTTYGGGTDAYGYGTIFKISPNGALTTLYSFTGSDGANPAGSLVQGRDGNFYGTTYAGGTSGYGTIFRISPNGALTNLYSFTGKSDGGNPYGGLVQASDGNFYGTSAGGQTGAGTVFRLRIVPTAPAFQAAVLTYGALKLTWSTEAGGRYQLQHNADLSSSNWVNLGSATTATGATLSATDSVTNTPRRFYRVTLLP